MPPRDIVAADVQPGFLVLLAAKDVPKAVIRQLHDAFKLAANESAYKTALDKFNLEPLYLNSEDSKKAVADSMEPLEKLVTRLGLGKM